MEGVGNGRAGEGLVEAQAELAHLLEAEAAHVAELLLVHVVDAAEVELERLLGLSHARAPRARANITGRLLRRQCE